jgi:hypothetical protein
MQPPAGIRRHGARVEHDFTAGGDQGFMERRQ